MALSDLERAILDFERGWVLETGSKDAAIRERLAVSPSVFYKVRRSLIGSDEALAYEPARRPPPAPGRRTAPPGEVRGPHGRATAAVIATR